jgi:hypothetical protein
MPAGASAKSIAPQCANRCSCSCCYYHYNGGAAVRREDDPDANFVYAQLREICPTVTLESLMEALQRRLTLSRSWQQYLSDYPVLLCPVSAESPFPDQLDVESEESFRRVVEAQMTQIALPLMGMPAISVATHDFVRMSCLPPQAISKRAIRPVEYQILIEQSRIRVQNTCL